MAEIQLGVVEAQYADMIWEHEPVSSSELVKLTEEAFHWKRTTAHNVGCFAMTMERWLP